MEQFTIKGQNEMCDYVFIGCKKEYDCTYILKFVDNMELFEKEVELTRLAGNIGIGATFDSSFQFNDHGVLVTRLLEKSFTEYLEENNYTISDEKLEQLFNLIKIGLENGIYYQDLHTDNIRYNVDTDFKLIDMGFPTYLKNPPDNILQQSYELFIKLRPTPGQKMNDKKFKNMNIISRTKKYLLDKYNFIPELSYMQKLRITLQEEQRLRTEEAARKYDRK